MFKKAVDSHNAHQPERKPATLSQQLFSSSPPVAPPAAEKRFPQQTPFLTRPTTRPLSNGTGNISKQRTPATNGINAHKFHTGNGLKRTSSGLVKALEAEDPFAEPTPPPTVVSKRNSNVGRRPSPTKNNTMSTDAELGVYFDENDFDSDIDLDVEDPATKPSISYPTLLPPEQPAPKPVRKPTPPSITGFVRREQTHDSGYETQVVKDEPRTQGNNLNQLSPKKSPAAALKSSQAIAWSSSPPEHLEPPSRRAREIQQFAYTAQNKGDVDEQPRPTKRRTLPWLEQRREDQEDEQEERDQDRSGKSAASTGDFTPLPKDKDKKYPWNTTASAIKEQQKALRQTNKKLTKDHAATSEAQKLAIEQKKKKNISRVFLSDEQQHVLSLVLDSKKSVFFTGSAGTGKSVLLREIIAGLKKKFQREPDRVAVTASTGLAACNIGGVTLHSFAGFGLGKEGVEELVKKIKRNQKAKHRWMRTKVLIVDEVSMVDGDMFDKLEAIARTLRNNGRPFGGIQLIITGDFFQLPPVPEGGKQAKFAFDAGTWATSIEHTIGLHHVFRQKDPVFAGMLNEMREGRLMPSSIEAFKKLNRPLNFEDTIDATELFPTRTEVDRANQNRMQLLHGDMRTFQAADGGTITDKAFRDKLLSNCMAPETIQLKKGAQVMLIKNIDETLVNGSLGKVIGFMNEAMFDNYQENEDQFLQSQADGDTDKALALQTLAAKRKTKITEMLAQPTQLYPVVRFTLADGTTRDLLCQRESWKIELPNGEVQASRSQIPLILAWALSIHKAQGQTLERVKVDLGKVFEKGQAYVALSRATSMGGLQVLRFDPKKVVAHERVRSFYAGLSRAETKEEKAGKGGGKGGRKAGISAEDYERGFVDDGWGDEGADVAYG